jgi:DNA polymerase I
MSQLATKSVRSTDDLKHLVAAYEHFGEFALDVETRANRKVRMLTLPGDIPPPIKGTSRAAIQMKSCPSCGREFQPRHGRKWCDDLCRLAAEKDKPALDARTNAVWSISLAGPGRADVIPCGHPDPRKQLDVDDVFAALEPLLFSDRRKIGQNVSFDLLSVAKYYDGAIPPPPYGDTITLIFLLNENLHSYKLGALTKRYLGLAYGDKLGEQAYTTFFEKAVRYSLVDAKMAWMLWWKIHPKLTKPSTKKLADLFDLEMEVMHVLMNMRQAGAYVDIAEFHHIRPDLKRRFDEKLAEIQEIVGSCRCERPRWGSDGINLNSTAQLAHYLYDEAKLRCEYLTESGARSTSAQALKALTKRHPVPGMVLEFKDLQKLQSTYVSGYIPHIDEDARIRASLNQTRAKTGRLSCSDPNLQNIPARYKDTYEATMVRRLFMAPPGKKLIVADYSQIELRILAHQTKDRLLVYAYTHGLDLHTQTATLIYRVPQDQVTVEQRSISKNSNFNLAFEGGPGRIVEMSGISDFEAQKVYDAWHKAYPGVKKWGGQVKRFCWEHGYVETLFGRKRRLPEITSDDWKERSYAERQAVNHPIQGTAADIAKIAIVQVHKALQGFDASLVLQVHDEFVIEVAERQVDDVLPLVRTAMEDVRLGSRPVLDVPLEANISVGNNWAEAKT